MMIRIGRVVQSICALTVLSCAIGLDACSSQHTTPAVSATPVALTKQPPGRRQKSSLPTPIKHVVVIVQENRTVDNLFQLYPGAIVAHGGLNSNGNYVALAPRSITDDCDPHHEYEDFLTDYAGGNNNGWDLAPTTCPNQLNIPYSYVPQGDIQGYTDLAVNNGTLLDMVYQGGAGPSLPGHKYLISGQSGAYPYTIGQAYPGIADNPPTQDFYATSGCDNPTAHVKYVDFALPLQNTFTQQGLPRAACTDEPTIFDLVDQAYSGQTNWKFYTAKQQYIWNAPYAVNHLWMTKQANDVLDPVGATFKHDADTGNLPPLSYIVPCPSWSDHPHDYKGGPKGPDWVAYLIDSLFSTSNQINYHYWDNTVVFVVWDDWGGWYEDKYNIPFPTNAYNNQFDPYENGYRTPVLVISQWVSNLNTVRPVEHTKRNTGSILAATEWLLGLNYLGLNTLDKFSSVSHPGQADDLSGVFQFTSPTNRTFQYVNQNFGNPGTCPNSSVPSDFDG